MGYGEYYCWIGSQVGSLIFLAIPMAAVIATNIVLYAMTVASISHVSNSVPGQRHNARKDLMLYVRIFCVLGFTWMFGLLTLLVDGSGLGSFGDTVSEDADDTAHSY